MRINIAIFMPNLRYNLITKLKLHVHIQNGITKIYQLNVLRNSFKPTLDKTVMISITWSQL